MQKIIQWARIDMDSRKEFFFKWLIKQNFDVPEQLFESVTKKQTRQEMMNVKG